ncbi:MAG: hypothetical protein Q8Q33_01255 [Chlamydiota bacterium]|nr:hypothetical protein [Chlamydiota bacterium]
MIANKTGMILCPHCHQETPLKSRKIYQGLTPVGFEYSCGFCQHELAEKEIEWVEAQPLDVIDTSDAGRICQYCHHYVLNPFTQRCMIWHKDVNATDSCERFEKKTQERKIPEIKKKEIPPFLR